MSEHAVYGPSGAGSVVLDLGAGTGVLVVYTPAGMLGAEIDVAGPVRTHSMVRRRDVGDYPLYAAVYPSLPEGRYVVGQGLTTVDVPGGEITTLHVHDTE
ncbi:MAG TPA: hypothetical protein VKU39_18400 [Streptosporangiaceae bacterium]|nr:hypothetical protein [Streptosporangiaceae bacterium]